MPFAQDMLDELLTMGADYNGPPRTLPTEEEHGYLGAGQACLENYAAAGTLTEQFTALLHMIQVVGYMALRQGFDLEEGWNRYHGNQMQRRRGNGAVAPVLDLTDLVEPPRCQTCGTEEHEMRLCGQCDQRTCSGCLDDQICGRCLEASDAWMEMSA